MECKISGEFRWRETRGFGPFKREVWQAEDYCCVVRSGEPRENPIEDLEFGLLRTPYGFVVEGTIKGVTCYFDEFKFGESRTTGNFTMITIANIEVRGHISVVGGALALSMARGFAA